MQNIHEKVLCRKNLHTNTHAHTSHILYASYGHICSNKASKRRETISEILWTTHREFKFYRWLAKLLENLWSNIISPQPAEFIE